PSSATPLRACGDKLNVLTLQIFHQPRGGWNIHRLADTELAARAKKRIPAMVQHANHTCRLFFRKKRESPWRKHAIVKSGEIAMPSGGQKVSCPGTSSQKS